MFLSIIYMPYMYWHTTIKYANMLTISKSWRVRKLWIVSSAGVAQSVAQSRKVCLHVLQGITCIYTIFILFPWNLSSPCPDKTAWTRLAYQCFVVLQCCPKRDAFPMLGFWQWHPKRKPCSAWKYQQPFGVCSCHTGYSPSVLDGKQ